MLKSMILWDFPRKMMISASYFMIQRVFKGLPVGRSFLHFFHGIIGADELKSELAKNRSWPPQKEVTRCKMGPKKNSYI